MLLGHDNVQRVLTQSRAHNPVTAHVLNTDNLYRHTFVAVNKTHKLRSYPQFDHARQRRIFVRQRKTAASNENLFTGQLTGHDIHAGRADKFTDKSMLRRVEQRLRCSHLQNLPRQHDDHLVCERQRLGLVMCHINHGVAELPMNLF